MQDYNHDYYRNLTLAYQIISNGTNLNDTNEDAIATTINPVQTPTPKSQEDDLQDVSNSTSFLNDINDFTLPEVREDFLGAIDTVCVWLR